ncbi:MAG TPA: HEAT repeat domain-containing protein [Pyrinomonadaceae bacterium]
MPPRARRARVWALVCVCLLACTSAPAQQNDNAAAAKARKNIYGVSSSDTPGGANVTITADTPLYDYSAYRSGDRFYVVIPQASAKGGGVGRGRGFEGAQVSRRGDDVVYSFKLQPGASANVSQKFNRLVVQFSAPDVGAQTQAQNANRAGAQPTPRTPVEQAGLPTPAPTPRATPVPTPQTVAGLPPGAVPTPLGTQPVLTATPMPAPSVTPPPPTPQLAATPEQIAQLQVPAAPAAGTQTNAPAAAAPATFGATVLKNWPWLLIALLVLAGLGLFVFARGGERREELPPPVEAAAPPDTTQHELEPARADVPAATTATVEPSVADTKIGVRPIAPAPVVTGKKKSKKERKAEKAAQQRAAERQREAARREAARAPEATATEATAAEASAPDAEAPAQAATTSAVSAAQTETGVPSVAAHEPAEDTLPGIVAGAGLVAGGAAALTAAEALSAPQTSPAAEAAHGVESPPVVADAERAAEETRRLLAGEDYDESFVGASDADTRRLVAAELMTALATESDDARVERARAAFRRHGFFDDATGDLRGAEGPEQRASAARTLGLFGDRAATPHLVAALEDPAPEVRRAAVLALTELQDPAAAGPLEALRWRETSRRLPRTLIQQAVEACAAAAAVEAAAPVESVATESVATETETVAPEAESVAAPTEDVVAPTESVLAPAVDDTELAESVVTVAPESESVAEAFAPEVVEAPAATAEERALEFGERGAPSEEYAPEFTAAPAVAEAESVAEAAPAAESPSAAESEFAPAPVAQEAQPVAPESFVESAPFVESAAAEPFAESAPVTEITPFVASEAATEGATVFAPEPAAEVTQAATEQTTDTTQAAVAPTADAVEAAAEPASSVEPPSADTKEIELAPASPFAPSAAAADEWIDVDVEEQRPGAAFAEPRRAFAAEAEEPAPAGWSAAAESQTFTDAPRAAESEATLVGEPFGLAGEETAVEVAPVEAEAPVAPSARTADAAAAQEKELARFGEDDLSIIPKAIQLRLESEDASERAASVMALARLNTDEAFKQICAAFDDPAGEVRVAAARALYSLADDRADSFTRALRESQPERRRHIGAAISESGLADEAIANLTGESRDKTYDAFSLLFLMAKAGETAPLIHAIETHPDNEVRLAVVKLLALSGQHEILPSFRRLAVRGSLPTEVRSAVMEAIYQISSQPQHTT